MSSSTSLFLSALAELDLPAARASAPLTPPHRVESLGSVIFDRWRERLGSWDHWPNDRQRDALDALALLETRLPGSLWLGDSPPAILLAWTGFPAQLLPSACLASCRMTPPAAESLALFILAPAWNARASTHSVAAGWLSLAAQFYGPISPAEGASGCQGWFELAAENNAPPALLNAALEGFGRESIPLAQAIVEKAPGVSDLFEFIAASRQSLAWSLMLEHCRHAWSLPDGALGPPGVLLWNPIAWRLLKAMPISHAQSDLDFLDHALRAHSALAPRPALSLASHLPAAEPWQRAVIEPLLAEAERAELHRSLINPSAPSSPISRPRL